MYFANRLQAGRMLASQIAARYKGEDSAVLALSDGGVVVGLQIARALGCPLNMLLTGEIELPHELVALAGISQDGSFTYNNAYSSGEIDELVGEYRSLIEAKKLEKLQQINRLIGRDGLISREQLEHRNLILVTDGLSGGFILDMALDYLKPISYKKLVVATPLASVNAVDRMHVLADDIYCLSPVESYISTNHYYDTNDVPAHEAVIRAVAQMVKTWDAQLAAAK